MDSGGGDKFRCLVTESSDTSLLMEVSGEGPDGGLTRKLGATFRESLTGLYGPPLGCKRKMINGSWSAVMYSAFSGVIDSGP